MNRLYFSTSDPSNQANNSMLLHWYRNDWMVVANTAFGTLGNRPVKGGGRSSHVWTLLES